MSREVTNKFPKITLLTIFNNGVDSAVLFTFAGETLRTSDTPSDARRETLEKQHY